MPPLVRTFWGTGSSRHICSLLYALIPGETLPLLATVCTDTRGTHLLATVCTDTRGTPLLTTVCTDTRGTPLLTTVCTDTRGTPLLATVCTDTRGTPLLATVCTDTRRTPLLTTVCTDTRGTPLLTTVCTDTRGTYPCMLSMCWGRPGCHSAKERRTQRTRPSSDVAASGGWRRPSGAAWAEPSSGAQEY